MTKPNFVFVQVDQWRADCLSTLDHPVVHTPFLDDLAQSGTLFTNAYSGTPTCIASRAALMTGLKQDNHGRVGYQDGVAWDYPVTLAGEFTKGGYQTQSIGKMHVYPERNRLGFENVILHDGFLHYARKNANYEMVDDYIPWLRNQTNYPADYFDHGVSCNSNVARPWDKPEHLHPTNYIVSESINFLKKRDPTNPFFLYMSFHRPHPPYDPPRWAFEQYISQDLPNPPVGDWAEQFSYLDDKGSPIANYSKVKKNLLDRAMAGYYGHMTHIDHQINRFMETLIDFDLHKDTYFIFTSDHGELMGDHNFYRKAVPFEGSAKVPLILRAPLNSKVKRGNRSNSLIEMRDIMPTLLDCADLPIPESIDGKSFLSCIEKPDTTINNFIHGEHTYVHNDSFHWIHTGRYKYVWTAAKGIELLFDLENDPQELKDLSKDENYKSILHEHREKLIIELTGREEKFVQNNELRINQKTVPILSHILKSK